MNRFVSLLVVVASAVLVPGCGEDPPHDSDFAIAASAAWSWDATEPASVGYTVALRMEQRTRADKCRRAADSTRLTVDGIEVPLVRDPATDCLNGTFLSPPVLHDMAVDARMEEDGRLVGEVTFDGLMPGTAATIVSPADGRVRAGDDLHIVPPPQLPTRYSSGHVFYPLDAGVPWIPEEMRPRQSPERRLDGIHVMVPALSGRVALILDGMPPYIVPDVSCPGFAYCTEIVEVTLGPFLLTVEP